MSVDHQRSLFLGSHLQTLHYVGNGRNYVYFSRRKSVSKPTFSSLCPRPIQRCQVGLTYPKFWERNSNILSSVICSKRQSKVNCTEKRLHRWYIPVWSEGLLLFRCSIFVAVISAVGLLVWYARLKATSFVETHVLPTVCSILSEYIQRDVYFGKVKSISPLGITLQSCSIGPHSEEFSCGEVPTVKLRIRPFASLRRGKIVINAFLTQPSLLVSQKEDFSWLGIPSPSENDLHRHHSDEGGIDNRTRVRRLAREESAARWSKERDQTAREAAEVGYTVPTEHSNSSMAYEVKDTPQPTVSSRFLFCIDERVHWKDHHSIDTGVDYVLKHADLENSFGVRIPNTSASVWSRILPISLRRRFKKGTRRRVTYEASIISKERILKRSAAAALSYFQRTDSGKFASPCNDEGIVSFDGNFKEAGNYIKDIHAGGNGGGQPGLIGKLESQGQSGMTIQACQSSVDEKALGNPVILSIGHQSEALDKINISEDKNSVACPAEVSLATNQVNGLTSTSQPFAVSNKKVNGSHSGNEVPNSMMDFSSPFNFKTGLIRLSRIMDDFFAYYLSEMIQKFKTSLTIRTEDLAAELAEEGVSMVHAEGIERVLPVTLDSVYFNGGTLMLLGYGHHEPREMVNATGHIKFQNYYSRIHVQVSGDCKEWRCSRSSQGGGHLCANVFVDTVEMKWHANLKVVDLFAPLFERILDIPATFSKGRASGEVHICMSSGDTFPNLHGQLDVNGLAFNISDAPSCFSELTATLCFRGQRIFVHNASGWFGDAPVEASGDFGINPEEGEFHLMCQVPCVEVNALMRTLKMKPLMFPLAGSVTAVFNCQGPLDAPVFVGSGIISRKTFQQPLDLPPSCASEAVAKNKEAGAVAAFDRIPFSHVSANFTYNLDNCVADLYGIRVSLIDGGEVRGAGNAWICPEGERDETAMDVNLSGSFLFDKVMQRYLPEGIQLSPLKIGELNGEAKLSGSLLKPRFDIKWAAPKAEDSFADARGDIVISHENVTVSSSSIAFDLFAKIETTYADDYLIHGENLKCQGIIPVTIEGVDVDLRMRGFDFFSLISSSSFESPRPVHLKASGKIKFQGKVQKYTSERKVSYSEENTASRDEVTYEKSSILGEVSLSGVKLNQLMLAPQLVGSLCLSKEVIKLDATGKPDENLCLEVLRPFLLRSDDDRQIKRLVSVSLQKGQLRANLSYQSQHSVNMEVRNLPLDELELASLRGSIQRAELQLNFQKRKGYGLLSVLRPKFSGVLGEALDVAARWSGDVITVEKTILEQAGSRYVLQGEYVVPGMRERYTTGNENVGSSKKAMAGHLSNIIAKMGRWRIRLEVPVAEVTEMLPLARLLSRSTDPVVRSRSKDLFIQSLQSAGFCSENLHNLLEAIQNHHNWPDEINFEDVSLPGLAELSGRWHGSLDASGGGNGDTLADFDFNGEEWEWGTYKTQRVLATGSYSNNDGLRFEKLFIQKDNATLHADGTLFGPMTNLHFAVLNFPVGLVPTLMQVIESTADPVHSLRHLLAPIKGILHMEGDLRGSIAKPECDVQIRLLDGAVGGIDLGRAEMVASLTPTSRFLFNANFEPATQSGHVHIQGSVPVTCVQNDVVEGGNMANDIPGGFIKGPFRSIQDERVSADEISDKKVTREKFEENWDFKLAESLRGLNWNLLDAEEVRIDADIKDGGMSFITALCPHANWLHGYADIVLQVRGTVEKPVIDGSASFHRATVSSPVLRKPLTNLGGTILVKSNRLCITSMESRVSRKGKLFIKGNLPLTLNETSPGDKIDLKCEVLEVRAKNIFSGQVDSQMRITGSILQPNLSGMIKLSHGEAYLPHDKGNGVVINSLASSPSIFPAPSYNRFAASRHMPRFHGSLSTSREDLRKSVGDKSRDEKEEHTDTKPGVDVRLTDLRLLLGPELRIVYPLILNFAVSGELELNGLAHTKYIKPKGILTFENGDVNLVATQVRLKRDHLNIAKFEPDLGLDPTLDLTLVGSEWQFRIQSRASTWQDSLVVTSTRSVDQGVLSPTEAARVFASELAESLLEGDGQLAFKKLATATLETLMPRIEGKGEFGQARWRLVYAPQIPSLLSMDPTVDPLRSLASNISFGTEVEVQLGKRLQASVVRQMKDSEMAMQWTLIYKLTSRLRLLFQSAPSNRLLFEYSAASLD